MEFNTDIRDDLRVIDRTAMRWLNQHTSKFDPLVWEDDQRRKLRRKAFSELAIYKHILEENEQNEISAELRNLVIERTNDNRYRDLILRNQNEFLRYAYPPAVVADHDSLNDDISDAVKSVLDGRSVWAIERAPFRSLDLWNFCRLFGYDDHNLEPKPLLRYSTLANPPDVIITDRANIYALTHNIFFYQNFGTGHPRFPPSPAPYDVEDVLTGLILRYMAVGNCDIVIELVMSGVIHRQIAPKLVAFAFSWVRSQTEQSGYVPGPETNGFVPDVDSRGNDPDLSENQVANWDQETREWGLHYHTNLVARMAVSTIESHWDSFVESAPKCVLNFETNAEQILSLGEALQAFSQYDLSTGASILGELAGMPVADTFSVTFNQAVAFLSDQQFGDEHYGYWTDERLLYIDEYQDKDVFHSELVEPTSQECERIIEHLRTKD